MSKGNEKNDNGGINAKKWTILAANLTEYKIRRKKE